MGTNLEQLADKILTTPGEYSYPLLHQLLETVKRTAPASLKPLQNILPELTFYLCDPDDSGTGQVALELFRYCRISQRTIDRLVDMQLTQPNKLALIAFGMSDSDLWDSQCINMLAAALAIEETTTTAAEILYSHAGAFNSSLAIEALQHLVSKATTQSRSEAISKLISHTEGSHAYQARRSLETILHTADLTTRIEIASKLAWTHNNGLDLLKITAADKDPNVRLASAKALSHGYRYRGKRVLAALSHDDNPQVRRFANEVLA